MKNAGIKHCPYCGSSELKNSRWFNCGDGQIKICLDCELAFEVFPHDENPELEADY